MRLSNHRDHLDHINVDFFQFAPLTDPFILPGAEPFDRIIISRPTMHYEPFQTYKWPARKRRKKQPKSKR